MSGQANLSRVHSSKKYICGFSELDYLVEDIYCYSEFLNSENLHIALVYLLSTLIADEVFNSLFYYIIYICIYISLKTSAVLPGNSEKQSMKDVLDV